MINPVWLRTFCTLAEIGHFTRTAEKLYMTQSGVSQHIHKLEEYLGQALLIREGKSFTLTSAGITLHEEGQKLILSLSDLEQQVSQDPSHEGIVKLASPGSVGLKLYPHLLDLQTQHPELVIEYRFAPNHEIESLIAEREIDIGIMTSAVTKKDVRLKTVADEELLLITPNSISQPSWQDLLALGFINHPDGDYHAGQLLSVNFPEFQSSQQFKCSGFSNQINLILQPVSLGLGFTVLPRHAVSAFDQHDKIRIHSLSKQVSETLYIGTHKNAYIPNRVKTVITSTEQCLINRDSYCLD